MFNTREQGEAALYTCMDRDRLKVTESDYELPC